MTGLKAKTNAGRPNWDKIFQKLQDEHKGKITVFYCGNPVVANILRAKCEEYGFDFRKEVFWKKCIDLDTDKNTAIKMKSSEFLVLNGNSSFDGW